MSDAVTLPSRGATAYQWLRVDGLLPPTVEPIVDAYADGTLMTRAEFIASESITVICKHNTPGALTTSLYLQPTDGEQIPEGEYALIRVDDRKDAVTCICVRFKDTGGYRIADLGCPVHGVEGTDPGDGYWDEEDTK